MLCFAIRVKVMDRVRVGMVIVFGALFVVIDFKCVHKTLYRVLFILQRTLGVRKERGGGWGEGRGRNTLPYKEKITVSGEHIVLWEGASVDGENVATGKSKFKWPSSVS